MRPIFMSLGAAALAVSIVGCNSSDDDGGTTDGGGGDTTTAPTLSESRETFYFSSVAIGESSATATVGSVGPLVTRDEALQTLKIGQTVYRAGDTGNFDVEVIDGDYYIVPNGDRASKRQLLWDEEQETFYFTVVDASIQTRVDFTVDDTGIVDCVYAFRNLDTEQLLGSIAAPVLDPPDLSDVAGTYAGESIGSLGGAFGGNISEFTVFPDGRVRVTDDAGAVVEYQIVEVDGSLRSQRSYTEDAAYDNDDDATNGSVEAGDLASDSFTFTLGSDDAGADALVVSDFTYEAIDDTAFETFQDAVLDGDDSATFDESAGFEEPVTVDLGDKAEIPAIFTVAEAIAGQYVATIDSYTLDVAGESVDTAIGETIGLLIASNGDLWFFEDEGDESSSSEPSWQRQVVVTLDDATTTEVDESNPSVVTNESGAVTSLIYHIEENDIDDDITVTLDSSATAIASAAFVARDLDTTTSEVVWQISADLSIAAPSVLKARSYTLTVTEASVSQSATADYDVPESGDQAKAVSDDGIFLVAPPDGWPLVWSVHDGSDATTATGARMAYHSQYDETGSYTGEARTLEVGTLTIAGGVVTGGSVAGYAFDEDPTSATVGTPASEPVYTFTFTTEVFDPTFLAALDAQARESVPYYYEITSYEATDAVVDDDYDLHLPKSLFDETGDIGWADFADLGREIDYARTVKSSGTPDDGTLSINFLDEWRDESGNLREYYEKQIFTFSNDRIVAFDITEGVDVTDASGAEVTAESYATRVTGTVAAAATLADGYYALAIGSVSIETNDPQGEEAPPVGTAIGNLLVVDNKVVLLWDGEVEEQDWEATKPGSGTATYVAKDYYARWDQDSQTGEVLVELEDSFSDTLVLQVDSGGVVTGCEFTIVENYDYADGAWTYQSTYTGSFTVTAATLTSTTLTATPNLTVDDADNDVWSDATDDVDASAPAIVDLRSVALGYDATTDSLIANVTTDGSSSDLTAILDGQDWFQVEMEFYDASGNDEELEAIGHLQLQKEWDGSAQAWTVQFSHGGYGSSSSPITGSVTVTALDGGGVQLAIQAPTAGAFASGDELLVAVRTSLSQMVDVDAYHYYDDRLGSTAKAVIP